MKTSNSPDNQPTVKSRILQGALLLFGLGLAFWGVQGLYNRFSPPSQPTYDGLLERDARLLQQHLENEEKWTSRKRAALLRLTEQQNPVARKLALELATSQHVEHRTLAAKALAHDSTKETIRAFKDLLLEDDSQEVRKEALNALQDLDHEHRSQWLKEYQQKHPNENRIVFLKIQYRITRDENRGPSLDELGQHLIRSDRPKQQQEAWKALMEVAPQRLKTRKKARELIQSNASSELRAHAILHLSQLKDPWLQNNMTALAKEESYAIRSAVLSSLKSYCAPKPTHRVIQHFFELNGDKRLTRQLIDETRVIFGEEAKTLLEQSKDKGNWSRENLQYVKELLSRGTKSYPAAACPNLKPTE